MQDTFQDPEINAAKPKASPVTIAIVAIAIAAVLLTLWFIYQPFHDQKGASLQETVNVNRMTAAQQDYAKKIEIGNISLSRAENFLHQEVTTLSGEVYNSGAEPVLALTLTAEFSDQMNQVVLRESRNILSAPQSALNPGERRDFEISFEHVPTSWNMQAPAVHVASLQLAPRKQ